MDLYGAFFLGGDIEYIKNVQEIKPIVKERKETKDVKLLNILRRIRITFIEDEINSELQNAIHRWIKKFETEYKAGEELKEADAKELSEEADRLEQMICRELIARPIVEFTRKGVFNQKVLLTTSRGLPSSIFDKKIWEELPSIAKSDFSDAAKCLLIEASTPAAMVALRGMEAVAREYYNFKKEQKCGKKALGVITGELRSLPNANMKLLNYIDYLRSEKRNLAQHPDKSFTQREAERIFMEIINVVHDIYLEITHDVLAHSSQKRE